MLRCCARDSLCVVLAAALLTPSACSLGHAIRSNACTVGSRGSVHASNRRGWGCVLLQTSRLLVGSLACPGSPPSSTDLAQPYLIDASRRRFMHGIVVPRWSSPPKQMVIHFGCKTDLLIKRSARTRAKPNLRPPYKSCQEHVLSSLISVCFLAWALGSRFSQLPAVPRPGPSGVICKLVSPSRASCASRGVVAHGHCQPGGREGGRGSAWRVGGRDRGRSLVEGRDCESAAGGARHRGSGFWVHGL